jgi:hypothetical protein
LRGGPPPALRARRPSPSRRTCSARGRAASRLHPARALSLGAPPDRPPQGSGLWRAVWQSLRVRRSGHGATRAQSVSHRGVRRQAFPQPLQATTRAASSVYVAPPTPCCQMR